MNLQVNVPNTILEMEFVLNDIQTHILCAHTNGICFDYLFLIQNS